MANQTQNILNRPITEEFKEFTSDLPSLEYQAACQYILLKPIRNAYHEIINNLNYGTDFKIYPDEELNTFETQLRHSIRTRLSYLTELDSEQQEIIILASAALKALTTLRKLLYYWDKTLSEMDINIPIHFVPEFKQHFSDKVSKLSKNSDPLEIIHTIYQDEVNKICDKYDLKRIDIPPYNRSSS